MNGRRRAPNTLPVNLKPGDYMLRKGVVWVRLPSGVGPVCLDKRWQHIVHDDGTITITGASKSIHDIGSPNGWHGYLERGVWREC